MIEALHYTKLTNNKVRCQLCPHQCIISESKAGICNIRTNKKGKLMLETYEQSCSMAMDPIEKKPLYHFYPGKQILSIGNIGCNLKCVFCQNWEISQSCPKDANFLKPTTVQSIVREASYIRNNIGVAFTYNEPTVWFEFMLEVAKGVKEKGLKNVMVTNGYINEEPLKQLCEYVDAFNIDLKAFNNDFYSDYTGATLAPVLNSIKLLHQNNKHIELTYLIIPGLNDDPGEFEKMLKWIKNELGAHTVLHISRYYPRYKMKTAPTSVSKIEAFYAIAKSYLHYVYIGNLQTKDGQNTRCLGCGKMLIERDLYTTEISGINNNGHCSNCNTYILKHVS